MVAFDLTSIRDLILQQMNAPDGTQKRMAKVMIYLAWILFLGLLTLFFSNVLEWEHNPNRNLANYSETGPREVVLKRNRSGHYIAPGLINNEPVRFLLDTGATEISIPASVAERLQLRAGRPSRASTANGIITVYDTVLDQVALGNIALNSVRAHINPHMHSETILLGMSFMKHLELIQRGDTLTLRQ